MPRRRVTASHCARVLLLVALLSSRSLCLGQADARTVSLNSPLDTMEVLAGIVHYTRWPESLTALRLCVNDRDAKAAAVAHRLSEETTEPRRITVQTLRNDAEGVAALLACQIVYVDEVPQSVWRPWLPLLIGHPVLTIGHGADFCSWGGMFCLDDAPERIRLRANLDSIARSNLHVNPQLLRLTQREAVR